MNISYNNKPAIMRRNGRLVAGEIAYKQRFSVDLSTTDEWTTMSGTYQLTVVATASGQEDSVPTTPIKLHKQ